MIQLRILLKKRKDLTFEETQQINTLLVYHKAEAIRYLINNDPYFWKAYDAVKGMHIANNVEADEEVLFEGALLFLCLYLLRYQEA
jgi:DMSO/TMAO reductase YedYZ heme-binding membrane subunit